jgi:hypothetical protein
MYEDDDLDTPLATDTEGFGLPPRDEAGRFVTPESEPETTEAVEPEAVEPVTEIIETPEAEPEPPPEAAELTEPEPEPDDKLAKQKVPYSRFKEAVSKERAKREAAEQELNQLRAQLEDRPDVDISEDELNNLGDMLIEGKTQDYAKGMKSILQKVYAAGLEAATERAAVTTKLETAADRVSRERMESAAKWQAEYPQFDPEHAAYDEDLLMEAVALRNAYESQGFSPLAAIERAVLRLVEAKPTLVPKTVAKPTRPSTVPGKIAASAAQPPLTAGQGDLDRPVSLLDRIPPMTDEEFDNLSDAYLEKLRRGVKM